MSNGNTKAENGAAPKTTATLGTFGGVFTPSLLTILGIILFLRMGFVIGNAGLARALVIIALANGVSILTSLSLAATATNIRVKGGGVYYLISRTLGVEYGGALGIVLFLAQSISIAFYAIGFAEATTAMLVDAPPWAPQAIAATSIVVLFGFAWWGADAATKLQYLIMAALFAAITAFFVGGIPRFDPEVLQASWDRGGDMPFWMIFAIFFPAVTGFTQGVAMSGDLKNPARSITRGTFAAVFLSALIYFAVAIVFAGVLPLGDLAADNGAMRRVSAVGWLVDVGVIAATLSSALASLLGAPRILQSLAADKVFPVLNRFAAGAGPTNNPRRAIIVSAVIALATIALGDLNVVAPVVSMFFLISYGLLNYATYIEAKGNSPSFRPSFRFYHGRLSLIGCLACLGAMLAIHPTAGAIGLIVLFAIHQYLWHRVEIARWADSSRSHRMQIVRTQLHVVQGAPEHPLHWRPVILAFSDDRERRERILRFASWIEGGSGFTTAVRVIEGEGLAAARKRAEAEAELRAEIARCDLEAFALVVASPDSDTVLPAILQSHGLGPVRANTMLLNWFDGKPAGDDRPLLRTYGRPLRSAARLGRNVIIFEATTADMEALAKLKPRKRRIDVWYGDDATGRLMLLLCHLMTRHVEWEDAHLRLLTPVPAGQDAADIQQRLRARLKEIRIEAEVVVVEKADRDHVLARSRDAAIVFLPFRLVDEVPTCNYAATLDDLLAGLPTTALVLAAQDIHLDAEPESGQAAEIASKHDAAEQAVLRAERLERDAEKLARQALEAREKVGAAKLARKDPERIAELEAAAAELEEEAADVRRRALKARAKAEDTEREALVSQAKASDASSPKSRPAAARPSVSEEKAGD